MTTSPRRISVVIPARNEAAQIAGTVRAVLAAAEGLPAGAVEVLVVDNASGDGTAARVRDAMSPGRTVQLVQCDSLGAARARNAGAAVARGNILVFVDADTHVPPQGLRRILCHVRNGYAAGIFRLAPQPPAGLRARCWWGFWNQVRRLPLARAKALPAFMFCTREAFDRLGPFDETVAIGEEWPILAGLHRADPHRLIYDRTLTAHTSGRRMELQPFGYTRTYLKYALAIVARPARIRYADTIREEAAPG